MTDSDYGPYRGDPRDPRTPDDDDRAWDELTPTERRAALSELPRDELIQQCLEALEDAAMWKEQALDAHRRRITAMGKAAAELASMSAALQAAIEREELATQRYADLYASVYPQGVAA